MPPIPPNLLKCVVYLYPDEYDAKQGVRSGATGFWVSVPSKGFPGLVHTYIVTNAHVIEKAKPFVRLMTVDGKPDVLPERLDHWVTFDGCPDCDDIAVCPLEVDSGKYRVAYIPEEMFVTEEKYARTQVGYDVFMVGRFSEHDGKTINLPAVRFGNIAMRESVISQKPSGRHHDQVSFLVEMRSTSGSSGEYLCSSTTQVFTRIMTKNQWGLALLLCSF